LGKKPKTSLVFRGIARQRNFGRAVLGGLVVAHPAAFGRRPAMMPISSRHPRFRRCLRNAHRNAYGEGGACHPAQRAESQRLQKPKITLELFASCRLSHDAPNRLKNSFQSIAKNLGAAA